MQNRCTWYINGILTEISCECVSVEKWLRSHFFAGCHKSGSIPNTSPKNSLPTIPVWSNSRQNLEIYHDISHFLTVTQSHTFPINHGIYFHFGSHWEMYPIIFSKAIHVWVPLFFATTTPLIFAAFKVGGPIQFSLLRHHRHQRPRGGHGHRLFC